MVLSLTCIHRVPSSAAVIVEWMVWLLDLGAFWRYSFTRNEKCNLISPAYDDCSSSL